jgi:hypothetical protein
MPYIGFSTGALSLQDFSEALRLMQGTSMTAVELSALRLPELPILVRAVPHLHLEQFGYISFHAPSRFSADEEDDVIDLLGHLPKEWPVIVHPDTIHDSDKWAALGSRLALENMDRRKSTGRSALELSHWFKELPDAKLCFDLAHAHQCDRTMTEAFRILLGFRDRICQLHISELDSTGHHFPLSYGSMRAFSEVASLIPGNAPVILESLNPSQGTREEIQKAWIEREAERAITAIGRGELLPDSPTASVQGVIPPTPIPA